MANNSKCPIWGTPATLQDQFDRDVTTVESTRAGGRYEITLEANEDLEDKGDDLKSRLTTWIVDQHGLGNRTPLIDTKILARVGRARPLQYGDRRDRFLQWFKDKSSSKLGAALPPFSRGDEPAQNSPYLELLARSESTDPSELKFLIDACKQEGLLKDHGNTGRFFRLSTKGYEYLDRLSRANPNSEQAFVAMWFDPSMNEAYDQGIDPAIQAAGYRPQRIDRKEHVNRIDDEIIAEIRRSRFVVADFTSEPQQPRGGVYFEAGFALGLGIPVIWMCHKDIIGEIHFDTRQYNHIAWIDPNDLFTQLKNRIEAVIGDGPLKP